MMDKLFEECLAKVDTNVRAEVRRNMDTINTPNGVTKKDLLELLKPFPDDAIVVVECCNVRKMVYNEKDNTIRID